MLYKILVTAIVQIVVTCVATLCILLGRQRRFGDFFWVDCTNVLNVMKFILGVGIGMFI
jgi:hypothetical protein